MSHNTTWQSTSVRWYIRNQNDLTSSKYECLLAEVVPATDSISLLDFCHLESFAVLHRKCNHPEYMLRLKTPRLAKAILSGRNPFQQSLFSLSLVDYTNNNGGNNLRGSQGIRMLSTTVRDKDNSLTGRNSRLYIYPELSKYRLSALVVVTSAAGFLCAGAPIDLCSLVAVTTGTALCAASAGTFNQVLERFHDAKMLRTRLRPLPSGRISTAEAFSWGATSGIAGTALLYTGTHYFTVA